MNCRSFAIWIPAIGLVGAMTAGCATRGYVRSQVEELSGSVDSRIGKVQQDLAEVRNSSDAAMARAEEAYGAAGESRDLALGKAGFHEVASSTVYFAFDSDELTPEMQGVLDQLADQIRSRPDVLVDIYGFTDSRGPARYNYQLGQRRADAALRYLAEKTPGELSRYAAVSFGKDLSHPDTTKEERADSRRVVVSLIERVPIPGNPPQAAVTKE